MYLSKKVKLRKEYWVKGKSKFLHIRLMEDPNYMKPTISSVIKVNWLKRIYARLRLFAKTAWRQAPASD